MKAIDRKKRGFIGRFVLGAFIAITAVWFPTNAQRIAPIACSTVAIPESIAARGYQVDGEFRIGGKTGSRQLFDQPVTKAVNRDDVTRLGRIGLDLLSQAGDVGVDRARVE